MSNTLGLFIAIVYVFFTLGLGEGLRRWRGYNSDFTRKVIHIGVGMLSWALPFLFTTPWYFVAACLGFAMLNFVDWRWGLFPAMMSTDRSNLGTVYFPLVAAVVALVFWEQPPLMVAALMPLTWGDGMAPVVGRLYGQHPYTVYGHTRTWEGSAGFFVFGVVFTWLALWLLPGPLDLDPITALFPAGIVTLVAMLVEAVSIWGVDNITVTLAAIVVLRIWPFM